ncbi:MAG: transglutaminase family protein [Lachnospira sp.]
MIYFVFVISLLENSFYAGRINISIIIIPVITYIVLILTGFLPDALFMVLVMMLSAAYFAMPSDKRMWGGTSTMFHIVMAIGIFYVVLTLVYPVSKNSRPAFIVHIQESILDIFKRTETKEPETPPETAYGGINGGKLGEFDQVEYTNKLMLTIKTGFKGPVYLRGYVGSVYEDNSWRELTPKEYGEYAKLFINAKDDAVHFSTQTSSLLTIIDYDDDLKEYFTANGRGYLENVLRRNYSVRYEESPLTYCYLPYGSLYYMSKMSSYDGYYTDNDKSALSSLQYFVNGTDYSIYSKMLAEYQGDNEKLLEYIKYEKQYREFVYDRYTCLGNKETTLINSIQEELLAFESESQYIDALKKYFRDNYTYTLAPGKTGENEDFISTFMINKKGYCTHFASAAVVLLRSNGIPARYVEGYCKLVNEGSCKEVNKQIVKRTCGSITGTDTYNEYIVEITDASAHAWVEIYKDGYGWVPYEFTPLSAFDSIEEQDNYAENIVTDDAESYITDYNYGYDKESDENGTDKNSFKYLSDYYSYMFFVWVRRLFYFLLIIIVIMIIIIVPERFAHARIRKMLAPCKTWTPLQVKTNVIKMYNYFEKMCRFFGIKRDLSTSYTDFAKNAMEQKICIKDADISPLIKCAQKTAFGREDIEYYELSEAVEAVKKMRLNALRELTIPQRLLFRYIWHL